MKVFGITFRHRRPSDREFVARDFAQFTLFAALVEKHGYAQFVKDVFYDTSSQTFCIDMNSEMESTLIAECINWCAQATLSQFDMFGTIFHKREAA